jgi:thiopeptide-type bacteriocin biosynthesis protein
MNRKTKGGGEAYEFLPLLFIRTPFYSFQQYGQQVLEQALKDKSFLSALWLASPDYYLLLQDRAFNLNQLSFKETQTLFRYVNRMTFRPTPFGGFAAFSVAMMSPGGGRIRLDQDGALLHLLPSRKLLAALSGLTEPQGGTLLQPNPTLYRLGDAYRFIRTIQAATGTRYSFELAAIAADPLTISLINHSSAKGQLTYAVLRDFITRQTSCAPAEADAFLSFLIVEQVLFTPAQGGIFEAGRYAGPGPFHELLPSPVPPCFAAWPAMSTSALSGHSLLEPETLQFSGQLRAAMGTGRNDLCYGAVERKVLNGNADPGDEVLLRDALHALRRLAVPSRIAALEDFKTRFLDKFEGQQVPLLLALDPDHGVPYLPGDEVSAKGLLRELPFEQPGPEQQQLNWTSRHRLLFGLWRNSTGHMIELSDADLNSLEEDMAGDASLPPSLSILYTRTDSHLVVDMVGGVTATAIIGRFSVFSEEVAGLCRLIAQQEAAANPEVLFADIGQCSDLHVDNINRRKPVYDHVIPINTFTQADGMQLLPPDDLLLSVRQGQLILESKTRKRRVIPRLPTAYNFLHNELSLFRLLCDLQYEQLDANLAFDLERFFPGMDHYPAVTYKKVMLSQARWKLTEADIRHLSDRASIGALHQWLRKRGIPELVSVGSGDQQLTFDFGDDWQVQAFLSFIKGGQAQVIKAYAPPSAAVFAGKEPLHAQYTAFLVKQQPTYAGLAPVPLPAGLPLRREFYPGTDWLYLKIYCSASVADELLRVYLYPVIALHRAQIVQWFFVRYKDPRPHLRLRLKGDPLQLPAINRALLDALQSESASVLTGQLQQDTYRRELERYSPELMEEVEELFSLGSTLYAAWPEWVNAGDSELTAALLALRMAECFLGTGEQLLTFLSERYDAFAREYRSPKNLTVRMDAQFRACKGAMLAMHSAWSDERHPMLSAFLRQVARLSALSAGWSGARRNALVGDLIHMQLNRLFPVAQRQHETLVYHFLHKLTVSHHRQKAGQNTSA